MLMQGKQCGMWGKPLNMSTFPSRDCVEWLGPNLFRKDCCKLGFRRRALTMDQLDDEKCSCLEAKVEENIHMEAPFRFIQVISSLQRVPQMHILPSFRSVCAQQQDISHLVLYSQVHSCLSYFIWLMQMSCLEQSDSVCQDSHYTVTEISVVPNQKEQWLILCQLWSLIREAFFQSSAVKEPHLSDYFWRTGLKKKNFS